MVKRISFSLFLFLLSLTTWAQQRNELNSLAERLERFGREIPQEKVFVHMDNTCYFLGDTIWFSAYTRQTNTDEPSKVSNVLYAELLNEDGYLVERKLIELKEGHGNGYFALSQPLMYSGFYDGARQAGVDLVYLLGPQTPGEDSDTALYDDVDDY